MINIAITNLGKYNEGELIFKWLELPFSEEEFVAALSEIGINDEYEEYFISDYETDLDMKIGEYENITKLNELAETLDSLDKDELEQLKALIEVDILSFDDVDEDIKLKMQDYFFIQLEDMSNTDLALGYALAEINGIEEKLSELNLQYYFDYEKYGRDASFDGIYVASNNLAVY